MLFFSSFSLNICIGEESVGTKLHWLFGAVASLLPAPSKNLGRSSFGEMWCWESYSRSRLIYKREDLQLPHFVDVLPFGSVSWIKAQNFQKFNMSGNILVMCCMEKVQHGWQTLRFFKGGWEVGGWGKRDNNIPSLGGRGDFRYCSSIPSLMIIVHK